MQDGLPMMTSSRITLRRATAKDAALVFALICELAAYQRLSHAVEADATTIAEALFGDQPRVFCEIAEWDGAPAGFVLWFYTFSTFRGRHGIWIEDLYVRENDRGKGIGTALLRALARRCIEERLGRLDWAVLAWNENALRFYHAAGARLMQDWRLCRLEGAALRNFGAPASSA